MRLCAITLGAAFLAFAGSASAATSDTCARVSGDVVLSARTPQVDLYDGANGKRVQTLEAKSFPSCAPIIGRSPNMMLQVDVGSGKFWVPPHMVRYRFAGKLPAVCRNLAMGSNQEKVGSTRGLGEGCPGKGATQ